MWRCATLSACCDSLGDGGDGVDRVAYVPEVCPSGAATDTVRFTWLTSCPAGPGSAHTLLYKTSPRRTSTRTSAVIVVVVVAPIVRTLTGLAIARTHTVCVRSAPVAGGW